MAATKAKVFTDAEKGALCAELQKCAQKGDDFGLCCAANAVIKAYSQDAKHSDAAHADGQALRDADTAYFLKQRRRLTDLVSDKESSPRVKITAARKLREMVFEDEARRLGEAAAGKDIDAVTQIGINTLSDENAVKAVKQLFEWGEALAAIYVGSCMQSELGREYVVEEGKRLGLIKVS